MKNFTLLLVLLLYSIQSWATSFSVDGVTYTITDATNKTVAIGTGSSKAAISATTSGPFTVPSSVVYNAETYTVTSIGKYAFRSCHTVTAVIIPNTVTSINGYAFQGCDDMNSVTIPNSVTSIGDLAFYNCTSLSSVTIPSSVSSIGLYAFANCTGLTSVLIPASVVSFSDAPFYMCTHLTAINVDNSNPNYSSNNGVLFNKNQTILIQYPAGIPNTDYTVPGTVITIGSDAFGYCSSLKTVTLPNTVRLFADYAFEECPALTSINIPNSLTSVGAASFVDCTSLTTITIPASVNQIGGSAFQNCSGLTSIYVKNTDPTKITLGGTVFDQVPVSTCKLYVPAGSESAYGNADQWKDFINIVVENVSTGIEQVSASSLGIKVLQNTIQFTAIPTGACVLVVDIHGIVLVNKTVSESELSLTVPAKGIYMVKVGDKVAKVVVN